MRPIDRKPWICPGKGWCSGTLVTVGIVLTAAHCLYENAVDHPTVEGNVVNSCAVGLAAFGSAVSGQGATFTGNRVSGTGALTTNNAPTYGAYLTTDQLGYGTAISLVLVLIGAVLRNVGPR